MEGLIVVLDVGKTVSKLTLWDREGGLLQRRTRQNRTIQTKPYVALDAAGIEAWLAETLSDFAKWGPIAAIIPLAHGAAAALIRDGALALPPIDYEEPIDKEDRREYNSQRDDFALTGSPRMRDGLNLGVQLHRLSRLHPELFDGHSVILPWPQYWAWVLSGVAACEMTSLGCHTDLWRPVGQRPSSLAQTRGWARMLAPLRSAGDVLGTLAPNWVARTGLPSDAKIYCGLHDSNAALFAARGFPEIADCESTVLSTGTWFVAMRTPAAGSVLDISTLAEDRDCLVNVDVRGMPIVSSRFMGGREFERLVDVNAIKANPGPEALQTAIANVLSAGSMVLPTMAPGFGPFPANAGRWIEKPADPVAQRVAAYFYLALVADASLDLIGARERILVEGRFADAELFVRALAALRPDTTVYVGHMRDDVSYGARRLIDPLLPPSAVLLKISPFVQDIAAYRARWRLAIAASQS